MRQPLLTLALVLAWGSSNAMLVTIEPDDYATGTNLSAMFAGYGIHLSSVTLTQTGANGDGLPIWEPVLSNNVYSTNLLGYQGLGAPTGQNVFGWDPTGGAAAVWGDMQGAACILNGCTAAAGYYIDHVLRVDFDVPVQSISALGWFAGGDPTVMFAFDQQGNQGDECVEPVLAIDGSTCAQRFPTSDVDATDPRRGWGEISVVRKESTIKTVFIGGDLALRPIDRIIVDVPEPNTLTLFGIALLGFIVQRRTPRATRTMS